MVTGHGHHHGLRDLTPGRKCGGRRERTGEGGGRQAGREGGREREREREREGDFIRNQCP